MGRGRFLPRERVARECRDAPVPRFRSPAYAAARMDRGRLPQVVRRKLSVDRNPERGRDFRDQHPDLRSRPPDRRPSDRDRRVDTIRIQLAGLSLSRLRARMFRRTAPSARRNRHARRRDARDAPGRYSRRHLLHRVRNQVDRRDRVSRDADFRRRRVPPNREHGNLRRYFRIRARRVQRDPLPALRRGVHFPDVRVSLSERSRPRPQHGALPANDSRHTRAAVSSSDAGKSSPIAFSIAA